MTPTDNTLSAPDFAQRHQPVKVFTWWNIVTSTSTIFKQSCGPSDDSLITVVMNYVLRLAPSGSQRLVVSADD